jgi:acyl-CoA synthetase (AMP-forming)/AMP-acid ligase II
MRLPDLLARAAALYGPDPAVHDAERSWTWAELDAAAGAVAARLRDAGVGPGDRVAIVGGNRGVWLAGLLGVSRAGAVAVCLSARLTPPELADLLADADVAALLADAALLANAAGVRWSASLEDAAAPGPTAPPTPPGSPHDDAVLLYTSGTTGRPKGVRLTHHNLLWGHLAWRATLPLAPGEAVLQVTPPWHAGAIITLLGVVAQGGAAVLRDGFVPSDILRLMRTHRVVAALMVPAMIAWVLREPGARDAPFPHLRLLVYAGAPMPQDLLADARATFGCAFAQGYGLTETSAVLTLLAPEDHADPARLATVGRVVLGAELRVVRPDGDDCAPGEVGRVLARGASVSPGYWRERQRAGDTWLDTGDLGALADGGWLTLVGRHKELVIVGGENVHPREVEAVFERLPGVLDVAVLGLPHPVLGEELVALVAASGPTDLRAARTLQQAARASLARFKLPGRVRFVASVPRNALGKLDRPALRAAWDAAGDPA